MAHEVDILLSCGCIAYEKIEGVIFTPLKGETRHCARHNRDVTISRVGYPYHVPDNEEEITKPKKIKETK